VGQLRKKVHLPDTQEIGVSFDQELPTGAADLVQLKGSGTYRLEI
jgi:hypothetical protein